MAKIVIKRSSEYVNKLRAIDLYLDGEKVGNITDSETQSFEVTTGEHQLRAKIDWCGSQEIKFKVKDDDELQFQLSSSQKVQRYIILLFVFGAVLFVLHIFFQNVLLLNATVGAFSFAILLIVHMLTINRNKYLTLKKEEST